MQQAPKAAAPPVQNQFKIKQRKRNAVFKYEPEAFRDKLTALIPADPEDLDGYQAALELNESKIDLKRYAEPFFELFITGGLLQAGGVIATEANQNSIFGTDGSLESIKARVTIIEKMGRRFKYLPTKLEEMLDHFLQYINKFGKHMETLAITVALFVTTGLISASVVRQIIKDHLVNDGVSLKFFTLFLKTCVDELSLEQVATILRKNSLDSRLGEFFASGSRDDQSVKAHFEAAGLEMLFANFLKIQNKQIKLNSIHVFTEMFNSNSPDDVIKYSKEQAEAHSWPVDEVAAMLWEGLVVSEEWADRIDQNLLWSPVFEAFCVTSKSELALINKVQLYCYEDSKFLKHFAVIIQQLYKSDAVTEEAILYWFEKGAITQGKTTLHAQMEPFVNWLKEQESDDEEED